jgi:hypothetical protein
VAIDNPSAAAMVADRKQARTILRYCIGLLREVPMLARQIEGETQESISLRNRITIEVNAASFRSTRGYSICAALLDELAFWSVDEASAEPDVEIINAVRPGMATIPGAVLLCASSPYARKGELWNAHRRHFGKDARECMDDAAFKRDRLQAALGKLRERLAELKDQEENARRRAAYDKAEAVRDELAEELADLYPAFAQKLAELLVSVVINDREIDNINNHYLPKGADRLLVAELKARGLPWVSNSVETPRITNHLCLQR